MKESRVEEGNESWRDKGAGKNLKDEWGLNGSILREDKAAPIWNNREQ